MNSKEEKLRAAGERVQESVSHKLRKMWWAFFLRGLFALVLAACALFWPQKTIAILTKILGAYFLFDGITGAISAFRSGDKGSAFVPAIVGLAAGLALGGLRLVWPESVPKPF